MYDTRRDALELAIRSIPDQPQYGAHASSEDVVTRAEKFHDFLTKKENKQ